MIVGILKKDGQTLRKCYLLDIGIYYTNTSEIPGELSCENIIMISLQVKITYS